jgi:TetR/AcrR family transcriptional regulator, transcriptional repressor for nem operon
MARQNDKRIRLVKGADQLFHQQGINTTTLADIAQLADVPLGNVYYYFKSKESIILAVIADRLQTLQQIFNELNNITNPKDRLKALLEKWISENETITNFGDPLGSLCLELSKQPGELQKAVANLMQTVISWCETQFNTLNLADKSSSNASQLAMHFISSLQGISLLGVTFKDSTHLKEHSKFLLTWLNNLA